MPVDIERINKNKKLMAERGIDAFICRLPENVVFLSGWWPLTGTSWAIFTLDGTTHLVTPACELTEARAAGIKEISTYEWAHLAAKDPDGEAIAAIASVVSKLGYDKGRLGIEESLESIAPPLNIAEVSLPGRYILDLLKKALPKARFFDSTTDLNKLRVIKTPAEIEKLRIANEIAAFGLIAFRQNIASGISEIELASIVNNAIAVKGSGYKGISSARGFAQVSSGKNTEKAWRPCEITTHRKLVKGDIVVLELGAIADGYWADNTRCAVTGEPEPEQQKIYDLILKAQLAAKEALKPGVAMGVVDNAAREIITKAGYGDYFIHITGHGIGWRYHEFPPLIAPGNKDILEEGMVTSIEPGVYIPGFGGIRVEDIVAVSKTGYDELSTFNRELS